MARFGWMAATVIFDPSVFFFFCAYLVALGAAQLSDGRCLPPMDGMAARITTGRVLFFSYSYKGVFATSTTSI